MSDFDLTPGSVAALACCLEVAAPKPGNVHRSADFEDLRLEDFLTSAVVLGQIIDQTSGATVGETLLSVIEATQTVVRTNSNLGIALLIVPLAKAGQRSRPLTAESVQSVLDQLTVRDTELLYEAIRRVQPGGLGSAPVGDVNQALPPTLGFVEAMALAADRDLVARQYTNQFQQVLGNGVDGLTEGMQRFSSLSEAIIFAHVRMMAQFPDSLIARKCGIEDARYSQRMASEAISGLTQSEGGEQGLAEYWDDLASLDFWLRSQGHRRNPGTTADLIAASLFVAIQNGIIMPPYR